MNAKQIVSLVAVAVAAGALMQWAPRTVARSTREASAPMRSVATLPASAGISPAIASGSARIPPAATVADTSCAPLSEQQLRNFVAPIARRYAGAVVVGTVTPGGETVVSFGRDRSGAPADRNTIFETASVSKVFSGLLLAQSVCKGEVALDEPVDNLLDWKLPHYGKDPITLAELAEHTSGLPAWPSNRGSTTSPYSTAELKQYLAHCQLEFRPGADNLYSNAGFALLGNALAYESGSSLEDLLQDRICRPLGMKHTHIGLCDPLNKHLAVGHNASGAAMHASAPTAGGGADGIRSSCGDLLRFVGAYAGTVPVQFQRAIQLSYQTRASVDDENDIGLAWYKRKDDGVVWKGGCIAGYRTYVGFLPDSHVGVVVLAGCNAFPAPQLGDQLLRKLAD